MPSPASSHKGEMDLEDIEELDPDVVVLERGNCAARLRGLLFRVALSGFMIGCCAGALYWSIKKGENGANVAPTHPPVDASVNFTIFTNEYSRAQGTFSITYRQPDSKNNNQIASPTIYPSYWAQDNTNKKLVHRKDNQTTGYIFEHYSYWVYDNKGTIVKCTYDPSMNYDLYINRLGLTSLVREHSAYESTHNHAKAYVYNGAPTDVIMEGTPQDAFLVTAYADASSGALLGWDTYFTSSNSSLVFKISYWYDFMVLGDPSSSLFDPPALCQPK